MTRNDMTNKLPIQPYSIPFPTRHKGPNEKEEAAKFRPSEVDVKAYTSTFLDFISTNPTVFHAVAHFAKQLESHSFTKLSERDSWASKLSKGGKYFFERNGSSLVAFVVGNNYESGNGAGIIASHVDALTTRLKPISKLSTKAGYVQLGVAPYAGALNSTWWDRDLGIGGRVLVKDSKTGKIQTKLVKLGWPIARIPTLAPHFGAAADISHPNQETQMVPIVGLDNTDVSGEQGEQKLSSGVLGGVGAFTATQPERLVKAIAGELNIQDCNDRICTTLRKIFANFLQIALSLTGSSSCSMYRKRSLEAWIRSSSSLGASTTSSALSLQSRL